MSNYRPISVLPVVSKIFEKLIRLRLVEYLDNQNIICKHQFGFRSRCDTADAVLEFSDACYNALDTNEFLIAVFIDLSKAFDTVDHLILISKLEHIGIRGEALSWLTSYLDRRKQLVSCNGVVSGVVDTLFGVPQGSILGPLLFIIYINDMYRSTDVLRLVHYADDTTLFFSSSCLSQLQGIVNEELRRIYMWLCVNKLSLNARKTTYMMFSNRRIVDDFEIKIMDVAVDRVSVSKFLGVLVDDKLTFGHHINYLCGKISKCMGVIYKLSKFVDSATLLSIYYSLIHSNLMYCIAVWGGSAKVHINRLQRLQNRAARFIGDGRAPIVLSDLCILDVACLYRYSCCVKMFRSVKLQHHEYFASSFEKLRPDHSYSTRHKISNRVNVPLCVKSRSQRSFYFNAARMWNDVPVNLGNIESLSVYKRTLKRYCLDTFMH